jgi:hypothetical protein
MKLRTLALAALVAPALPAQAQTGMEAFNPFTMLAPIMTPMGMMLAPMMAPMNNPATMFNPAVMANPMANPMAMMQPMPNMQMPAMPGMQAMPNFAAPQGMVPFTGLQATPQSFGMAPAQMANPFAMPQMANPYMTNPYAAMPFAFPGMPAQAGFPTLPNFPLMFPPAR